MRLTFDPPSKEFTRFARFLTVGALGTFLDFGLLTVGTIKPRSNDFSRLVE